MTGGGKPIDEGLKLLKSIKADTAELLLRVPEALEYKREMPTDEGQYYRRRESQNDRGQVVIVYYFDPGTGPRLRLKVGATELWLDDDFNSGDDIEYSQKVTQIPINQNYPTKWEQVP